MVDSRAGRKVAKVVGRPVGVDDGRPQRPQGAGQHEHPAREQHQVGGAHERLQVDLDPEDRVPDQVAHTAEGEHRHAGQPESSQPSATAALTVVPWRRCRPTSHDIHVAVARKPDCRRAPCHRRRQQGVTRGHHPHGGGELLASGVLEQEAAGAGPQGLEDEVVGVEGGEDQDRARSVLAGGLVEEAVGGLQAVQARHSYVHQDHVGSKGTGLLDGLEAVPRLTHHLDVGLGLELARTPGRVRACPGWP